MKLILPGTLFFFLSYLIPGMIIAQNADSTTYFLYPTEIPNSKFLANEKVENRENGGRFISKITTPTITYFSPKKSKNKAIIICPGGGYRGLAIDKEGYRVAKLLALQGYHAFVLKYRCPDDSLQTEKIIAPVQDAQMAIIRAQEILEKNGFSDVPIGIMGFSAGGHLASLASNYNLETLPQSYNPENKSTLPAFSILVYPVISMVRNITHMGSRNNLLGLNPSENQINEFSSDQRVNKNTPPTFIIHAGDDKAVNVQNTLNYYNACKSFNVPVEMHIYARGGHGFGLNNTTTNDSWIERLFNWLLTF